ncbi:4-alpha-glucanotransferase [Carbonactinospora thermoautotrophica]|uniref:4-alpha-glucanotransferase n=1 Tax=Carbonactinospora thermoautotrophica TaxID=1469144 RepID=A0A132NG40_9ACTN|nr:4-alpha-glucanotransferase [Carbonactinospora thermoautotrophica]KWX00041.1 4-alpha-glucanotransferase [Carbonactinospora thermoautotrophica]KWX08642.1 4-alpha-glucanotransferase [Carbonactinospora thermoautotrophica]
MTELTPELAELAAEYGIATEYRDWRGRHVRVPAGTIRAVLAALDVDASTPEAIRRALHEHRLAGWRRMLPLYLVTRAGWTPYFHVHVTHGDPVEVWVTLEDGTERRDLVQREHNVPPVEVDGRLVGEAAFDLPGGLPLGWHTLHARSGETSATAPLIVTPDRLELPAPLRTGRAWGFMTQLYATRSRRSWGIGDLVDLADLARWSGAELGAGFVLVNPLHAAEPVPPVEPSPYLPTTRRFFNPLYIRVEEIPEYAYLRVVEQARVYELAEPLRRATADLLDRDAAWRAKREALWLVYQVPRTPGRQAAFELFKRREGQGLVDFATWCALAEEHGLPWQRWPEELRDPEAVAKAREQHAEPIDFHCWLQWVLDEQLAAAQRAARAAGMPIGIMHDLAVGVHAEGADAWALQDVLARGITAGAPADAFNQQGQDWSQPPWRPDRLAEAGFVPYRDMLRTVLRHAGGIRVDHVIGLFRLWWVPRGMTPADGTYVRYDHEALVGILALEAHRAGAVVVGEDLGTVEPWVRDYLRERGLLGTSILWFERDQATGGPLRPEHWRALCLGTVTTHDLPPTAGYLAGEHVALRERLGLLARPVAEEQAEDLAWRQAWVALLEELGLLRPAGAPSDGENPEPGAARIVEALHRFLTRTPCRLLGVALPDAVGDRRTQNQPGTKDEYPNWRIPLTDEHGMPVTLEDLPRSARLRSLVNALREG